jgi:hypothetical protein
MTPGLSFGRPGVFFCVFGRAKRCSLRRLGLFDKLRNESIDVIESIDDSRHTLVWRFPRDQNDIKNRAQSIESPGQVAVFVHRGQLAHVFEPSHDELKTDVWRFSTAQTSLLHRRLGCGGKLL